MYTTIEKLRASSALQNRVTTVVNALNKEHASGTWPVTEKFPIYAIGHSNSIDDVQWVFGAKGTHAAWPEMEKAVLEVFGHRTRPEHTEYVEQLLQKGKAKALVELDEKYKLAADKLNGVAPAPAPAPAAEEKATTPITALDVVNGTVPPSAPPTLPAVTDYATLGVVVSAIGKVVQAKSKSLNEAVAYSLTPTGSRVFGEYVTAQDFDATAARKFLKENSATLFAAK